MTAPAQWFVDRDDAGTVWRVARIVQDAEGMHGEYLDQGTWVVEAAVLGALSEGGWGTPVSADEGEAVVRELTQRS